MASSIPIPPQASGSGSAGRNDHKPHRRHHHHLRSMDASMGSPATSSEMSPSPSASSSSSASSAASPSSLYSAATPPSRSAKGKEPVPPLSQLSQLSQSVPAAAPTRKQQQMSHRRRPSLLGSAIMHQEANVIDIGDPDGAPRLISYLSSSQGFIWNPEIFVPSYIDYEYTPIENCREPIIEIFLSDEEIQNMLPE